MSRVLAVVQPTMTASALAFSTGLMECVHDENADPLKAIPRWNVSTEQKVKFSVLKCIVLILETG